MIYSSRDMKRGGQIFFVILDCFLPFYPTNIPKKMKKKSGDITSLHVYHKRHWGMVPEI